MVVAAVARGRFAPRRGAGGVEARARTPRHDPADEPLSTWVDEWFAAYDAGAGVTTYGGLGVR